MTAHFTLMSNLVSLLLEQPVKEWTCRLIPCIPPHSIEGRGGLQVLSHRCQAIDQPSIYTFNLNLCENINKLSNVLRLYATLNDDDYGWE